MPNFSYIALDAQGKEKKGTLEVGSQQEAIGRLKEMGFYATKVSQRDFGFATKRDLERQKPDFS